MSDASLLSEVCAAKETLLASPRQSSSAHPGAFDGGSRGASACMLAGCCTLHHAGLESFAEKQQYKAEYASGQACEKSFHSLLSRQGYSGFKFVSRDGSAN